ncbi:FHA domain-containing protein [Nocardia amamiensis]|uniref:FHA domain-containing protein n=1 Tax=Nocardia amamiensis TaxID=404578 RepID=UPI00082D8A3E|nr:FHA domain-containing protein [Nocardia amamiensis]
MSGQIEVVPGAHLVASVGGAVVVIAHRGQGAVAADTMAARTMAALLGIVREAIAHDRHRSGRAVARLATSWLMNLSNGEEDEAEFGVITPVEDGVAVFLHGGVTAILAGPDRTEVLRGRDAGFTVDRVVTPAPGIGAGLFVDEAGHNAGSLPGRGIFALEAGTAPGSGAVLWAGPDPAVVSHETSAPQSDHEQDEVPEPGPITGHQPGATAHPVTEQEQVHAQGPIAGHQRVEQHEVSVADASAGYQRASAAHQVSEQKAVPTPGPAPEHRSLPTPRSASAGQSVSAPHPSAEQEAAPTPHRAEPVSDAPPSRPEPRPGHEQTPAPPRQMSLRKSDSGDAATDVDLQARASGAGVTPPVARPVPPPIPPQAERGGTRPDRGSDRDYAIANDSNLAETVVPSAEAIADALGSAGAGTLGHRVLVQGFQCARQHHNDPRVSFCAVCGIRMDQLTCVLTEGVRPPLGVLLLDDGTSFVLDNDCVLGREPEYAEAVARGARPVRLDDSSGGMSRAHAEIRLIDWDVTVVDGGSTNGTHIRQPGRPDWIRANPGHPVTVLPGAQIQLGGRVLTFDSPHGQL